MTKSTIHEQALQQQHALFDQVLPPDRYNNNLQESCYLVDAPALGKGTHRVFIARKDDKPVAPSLRPPPQMAIPALSSLLLAQISTVPSWGRV
ncbi:Electron transport complex protein RnfG [Salmonella enterica subsp. enterica]|uniref:Electron transport complex protein RnfG n=1 Tax=Salmonella enterica I TaxID=59201 RepID=A0A379WUZ1_SALET|nr:Electron transport complex protein RnfG [Salmonella enterica subsp. enterica]